jgi:hypothetical protein
MEGLRAGSLAGCTMSGGTVHAVIGVTVSQSIQCAHRNRVNILDSQIAVCAYFSNHQRTECTL